MDEKISLDAIAAYGDAYSEKISNGFFSSKSRITGPEILKLTNVPQVNMFILRELLVAWKDEMAKMRSPYFDYDDTEVKEALGNLMTVLSNHIAVSRQDFDPLLRKAVRQSLLVIFNPYDFFSILVAGNNNRVEVSQFKEEIKYLRINRAPIVRMVQKLEERQVKEVPGNEAFAILDQILEEVSFTPEDLDEHIRQFSATLPLDPAAFYPAREVDPQPATQPEPQKRKDERRLANDQKEIAEPTLNDRMQDDQRPAFYNTFRRIPRIREHLTINQKFMFTKVLFYGDFESFSRTVEEIDELSDMESAMKYLEVHSSNWDRESVEFHEFMEMVEKRFAS